MRVSALGTTLTVKMLSRPSRCSPRNTGSTAIASATGGWPAARRTPAARCWREYFPAERIAELSERIDPRDRPASTIIRCSAKGERFPVADPDMEPRLSPARR